MPYSEDQKAYHRAYYHKRRQKILDYLGGVCVSCGSADDLQIDHRDRSQKSFDISTRMTLEKIKDELAKCQLLCRACHIEKTRQEQTGFTHGLMTGWMRKKCPCDLCEAAKWAWYDRRNATRRKGAAYRKRR